MTRGDLLQGLGATAVLSLLRWVPVRPARCVLCNQNGNPRRADRPLIRHHIAPPMITIRKTARQQRPAPGSPAGCPRAPARPSSWVSIKRGSIRAARPARADLGYILFHPAHPTRHTSQRRRARRRTATSPPRSARPGWPRSARSGWNGSGRLRCVVWGWGMGVGGFGGMVSFAPFLFMFGVDPCLLPVMCATWTDLSWFHFTLRCPHLDV